jgi:hypothetical protein
VTARRFLLLAATLALPATAQAQFGSIMRRAAGAATDRLTDRAGDKAAREASLAACGREPSFTAVNPELTPELLDKMLRGLEAQARAGNNKGRDNLQKQRDELQARIDALDNSRSGRDARYSYVECRNEYWEDMFLRKYNGNPMQFALDPERQKRARETEERAEAAAARGDTTRAKAIRDSSAYNMFSDMGYSKEDSAAVDKKCGKPPAPSRQETERDELRKQLREIDGKLADIDADNSGILFKESGLPAGQLGNIKDRASAWVYSSYTKPPCGYSRNEQKALDERAERLRKVLR